MKKIYYLLSIIFIIACTKEIEPLPQNGQQISFTKTNGGISPSQLSFTAPIKGAKAYKWDFGQNQGSSTIESPTYTYSEPGTYKVIFKAFTDRGSVGASQDVIITAPIPQIPNFTISSNNNFYENSQITCTLSNPSTDVTSYNWQMRSATTKNLVAEFNKLSSTPLVFNWATAGDYEMTLTVYNKYSKSNIYSIPFTITKKNNYEIITGGGSLTDKARHIVTDASGAIYIAGNTQGGALFDGQYKANNSFFVAKYSNEGRLLWYRDDATNKSTSIATGMALDKNGNVCVSFDDQSTSTSRVTGYVKYKTNNGSDGGSVKIINPASGTYQFHYNSITVDASNNVILLGNAINVNNTSQKFIVLAKFNSTDTAISVNFSLGTSTSVSGYTEGASITAYDNNNIYISGRTKGNVSWGNGISTTAANERNFVAKLNSSLNFEWVRKESESMTGNAYPLNEPQSSIVCDALGNVFIFGRSSDSGIDFEGKQVYLPLLGFPTSFIAKFSPSGTIQWLKNPDVFFDFWGTGINKDKNGDILLVGHTDSGSGDRICYQKFNNLTGNFINEKGIQYEYSNTSGDIVETRGICEDIYGNIFAAGYYYGKIILKDGSSKSINSDDVLIVKFLK